MYTHPAAIKGSDFFSCLSFTSFTDISNLFKMLHKKEEDLQMLEHGRAIIISHYI